MTRAAPRRIFASVGAEMEWRQRQLEASGSERTIGPHSPILDARGISKTYGIGKVRVRALRRVSLAIEAGDFVFVTGRNGAGKTTLLHCLAVLEEPDEGELLIDGAEVTERTQAERSELRLRRLGYVFQERALVAELTAVENVMLPAMMRMSSGEARRRAETLLARLGLQRQAGHLPGQLSGGEQQRTVIARALINDPAILFVDEPTASLDSLASREVLETFARLNRDDRRTIVMVSHEEADAGYARRMIRMSDGEIVEDRRLE
jgi:putative ABC transport system ATP-binding protein